MKGLLNNPKFVLALAAGAFAVAGTNILRPLFSVGAFDDEEFVAPVGFESADAVLARPTLNSSIDRQSTIQLSSDGHASLSRGSNDIPDIGWATIPRRDPFRFAGNDELPKVVHKDISLGSNDSSVEPAESVDVPEQVNVNAVVIGPSFKLAVVDGQLLKEGEVIRDGRINVLNSSTIEYENEAGISQVFPIEHLNLDPNTQ